jgi:hypothetical protein
MAGFRLLFLAAPRDHHLAVLEEREIRAADVSDAVRAIADVSWPVGATSLRLTDADGRELYERRREGSRDRF